MPLNEELRQELIGDGIYEDGEGTGDEVLKQLGVDLDSAFADFYAHGTDTSYVGVEGHEIDDILWISQNSSYLEGRESLLGLPTELVPLDAFEGGGGFFFSTANGGVYEIELGEKLRHVIAGDAAPLRKISCLRVV